MLAVSTLAWERMGQPGLQIKVLLWKKQTRKNEDKEHTCSSEWHMGHVRPQLLGGSDQEGSAILPSASPSAEDVPCLSG